MSNQMLRVNVTSPDGLHSADYAPGNISMPSSDAWQAQGLNFQITAPASDAAVVVSSLVQLFWGSQRLFYGRIYDVQRAEEYGSAVMLQVSALDMLADAEAGAAAVGTSRTFAAGSPVLEVEDEELVAGHAEDDAEWPYYLSYGSDNWLIGEASLPAAELAINTPVGNGTLRTASIADQGFAPRGYVQVSGSHCCWYDGYHPDPAAGGAYTFYGVEWNQFTSAGGPNPVLAGTDLYQVIPKSFAPGEFTLIGITDDGPPEVYERLVSKWYTARLLSGRVDFHADPLAAPFDYLSLRALKANLYDRGAVAGVLYLDELLGAILASTATGALALGAGDYSIDASLHIPLSLASLAQTTTALAALQSLCAEVDTDYFPQWQRIIGYFDSGNLKYTIAPLIQAANPHVIIGAVCSRIQQSSIREQALHYVVSYARATPSLITSQRMWHPAIGDSIGINGAHVDSLYHMYVDKDISKGWTRDISSAGHAVNTHLITDGDNGTGIGIGTSGVQSLGQASFTLVAWFPEVGGSRAHMISRAKLVLDLRRYLVDFSELTCGLYGLTDYTPGSTPDLANAINLSDHLIFRLNTDQRKALPHFSNVLQNRHPEWGRSWVLGRW